LAYVFGRRQDAISRKLKSLLEPFGLTHYFTDQWCAYTRHLAPEEPTVGKMPHPENRAQASHPADAHQKRLVGKTICFSKTTQMHEIVVGLFVNRYALGRAV
jgi:insertion element IS1 protein InsB